MVKNSSAGDSDWFSRLSFGFYATSLNQSGHAVEIVALVMTFI